MNSCIYVGTCVVKAASCTSYTPLSGFENTWCTLAVNSSGAYCTYSSGTSCSERACTDSIVSASVTTCSNYLRSCTFIGTGCVTKGACTSYTPTPGSEAAQCTAITNLSGVGCIYSSGTTCAEKSCADAAA